MKKNVCSKEKITMTLVVDKKTLRELCTYSNVHNCQ